MHEDYKAELARKEAYWEYRRRVLFPFWRDAISLLMGFAFLGLLIWRQVSQPWPYIIVAGLCGFPGWMRLVVPLLSGVSNMTDKAAEAIESAADEHGKGEQ